MAASSKYGKINQVVLRATSKKKGFPSPFITSKVLKWEG
jgi:hypothetical protein